MSGHLAGAEGHVRCGVRAPHQVAGGDRGGVAAAGGEGGADVPRGQADQDHARGQAVDHPPGRDAAPRRGLHCLAEMYVKVSPLFKFVNFTSI